MRTLPLLCGLLLSAGLAAPEVRGRENPTETDTQKIDRLVALLDAEKFDVREQATKDLLEMGLPVVEALEPFRQHPSAEVRGRVRLIIDSLTIGVRRRELTEFAMQRDELLDLERGMWLIARILNPKVKQADMSRQLDELAGRVRDKLEKLPEAERLDPEKKVAALRQVLFAEEQFIGNVQDYENPDNSSLDRVLATKKGLPILLSHVTIAVARRADIPIVGVPMSGRYIVKYDGRRAPAGFPQEDVFLHPFEGGKILTDKDLKAEFPGQTAAMVEPDTKREVLTRMLRNLTSHLETRGKHEQLQQATELLELLEAYGERPLEN